MKTYVECYNNIIGIGFKLAESGDEYQVAMGNKLVDAIHELDDVIETRLEQTYKEALKHIDGTLRDLFNTENI